LFILLIIGSAILISSTVLMVRKRAFEAKLKGVSDEREASREASRRASVLELQTGNTDVLEHSPSDDDHTLYRKKSATVHVQEASAESSARHDQHWVDDDQVTVADLHLRNHRQHSLFPMAGVGARPDLQNHPRDVAGPMPLYAEDENPSFKHKMIRGTQKYFLSKGKISRNSQFHGLTSAEREELGGVELKAVSFLSVVVSLYFVMCLLLGIIGMGAWLQANHPDVAEVNGLNPFWTGAFFAVSAFANSGMSLLDMNMTALQLK
jgi:hypothetical protein